MIDLSNSKSWHLQVLEFFDGWHSDAIRLSYLERLTTCSYFWLVAKSLVALVMLSVACFTVASSVTIHLVLTGMLYTNDILVSLRTANVVLLQHFGEQFGIVGAIYGGLGYFILFLSVSIILSFAMLMLIIWLNDLLSKIKQNDFQQVTLKKRIENSSTYKILHSIFNKYCVSVKIHHD